MANMGEVMGVFLYSTYPYRIIKDSQSSNLSNAVYLIIGGGPYE
jgi:hypothetical protein